MGGRGNCGEPGRCELQLVADSDKQEGLPLHSPRLLQPGHKVPFQPRPFTRSDQSDPERARLPKEGPEEKEQEIATPPWATGEDESKATRSLLKAALALEPSLSVTHPSSAQEHSKAVYALDGEGRPKAYPSVSRNTGEGLPALADSDSGKVTPAKVEQDQDPATGQQATATMSQQGLGQQVGRPGGSPLIQDAVAFADLKKFTEEFERFLVDSGLA